MHSKLLGGEALIPFQSIDADGDASTLVRNGSRNRVSRRRRVVRSRVNLGEARRLNLLIDERTFGWQMCGFLLLKLLLVGGRLLLLASLHDCLVLLVEVMWQVILVTTTL